MKKREVQGGIERPRVGITNAVNHSQYRSEPSAERSQLDLYKRWRLPVVIFVLLMVPVAVDQIWVHVWRFVPVSYDTTRLMGPVSKDGGINYVRALNQLARRGVTSKNDAAVLLIKAVGPKLFPAEVWYDKDILWQLDMQPFKTNASRLIPLAGWLRKRPLPENPNRYSRWRLELNLGSHPWTATRYPVLKRWTQANREPLALFASAVKRPRYYVPLESLDRGLIHARVPLLRPLSFLVQVAAMRGMMLLGQGDAEGAVRWANRINRLAILVAQSPDVVSYLLGIRFESVAMRMDQAAANSDATHIACYRRGVTVMRCLTEVAVALAKFKKVRGKYPATLSDLVPTDLKSAPKDAFSGKPFQYAVTAGGRGFQVKSLGLPPDVGGLTLRRDIAANIVVDGGNWATAAK